jgi:hypothetical protein
LAALLCSGRVDAGRLEAAQVFLAKPGGNNVESTLTGPEAFFDEREQHTILPIRALEKSANVAVSAERRAAEPAWLAQCTFLDRVHVFPLAADAHSINRGLAVDGKDRAGPTA